MKTFGRRAAAIVAVTTLSAMTSGSYANSPAVDGPFLPLLLDRDAISGIGLEPVAPSRPLPGMSFYSRTLYEGDDIVVRVYAATEGSIHFESTKMDEYVHVLNGRAILREANGTEHVFESGSSFIVPSGFSGDWISEGNKLYQELIVYTKDRRVAAPGASTSPIRLDETKMSGIGLDKRVWSHDPTREMYTSYLYRGPELTIAVVAGAPATTRFSGEMREEFVHVLNGTATLTPDGHQASKFYSGDFFAVPNGFVGSWKSDGNNLYRELVVGRSK